MMLGTRPSGGRFASRGSSPETSLQLPRLGNTVPDMGKKAGIRMSEAEALYASANLSDALFTRTQQRVLSLLFGEPGRALGVGELIQMTGAGSGAVQRELARLAGSGLLSMEKVGNLKRYRANPISPIHDELVAIVRKTFGLVMPIGEALAPLADRIELAFIYGSVAKRSDTATSDIDLMVVSDKLTYADVVLALYPLIERLRREVNPTLYSRAELRKRREAGNAFVGHVVAQPKLWVIGGEHGLSA